MIPFVLAIVVTEALVELVVAAEIFAPLRAAILERLPRAGILLSCGYCLSVWVAVGTTALMAWSL